jgi:bifunctional NMN adenylyltransferase/nudix hydrolase
MIYAAAHLWPVLLPTVDIAVFTTDYASILLGRKDSDPEGKYRFIGGHAEKKRPTYEADARSEVFEETSLDPHEMQYIGSAVIPDWRYDTSDRGVKTSFFATTVMSQGAKAADDIVEVRWFKTDRLEAGNIVDTHQPLFALLVQFLKMDRYRSWQKKEETQQDVPVQRTSAVQP